MTLDDFMDGLDRHGGDFDAWPEEQRQDAVKLRLGEPQVEAALRAQVEVDGWLARTRTTAPAAPAAWLAEVARRPQARLSAPMLGRRRAFAIAAAAACLIVGVTVGAAPHFAPEPSEVLTQALAGSAGMFDVG